MLHQRAALAAVVLALLCATATARTLLTADSTAAVK
jgi:hypothetical protein